MVKQFFFLSLLSLFSFTAAAQSKCGIYKAYAYFTVSIPGAQMVDDNGRRIPPVPNVERFIYLECTGKKKPAIGSITYNSILFKATITDVSANSIKVGKRNLDEKEILLKPKKGNRVWKLELQPVIAQAQDREACKNIRINLMQLSGVCTYRVTGGELQLYTPPMY